LKNTTRRRFVSIDIDSYSATRDALRPAPLFLGLENLWNHKFAGELLAIEEFNRENTGVKIDRWYGAKMGHAFPERIYFEQMYLAHDLDAISRAGLDSRFERRVSAAKRNDE
jgi:hypothetical protein